MAINKGRRTTTDTFVLTEDEVKEALCQYVNAPFGSVVSFKYRHSYDEHYGPAERVYGATIAHTRERTADD